MSADRDSSILGVVLKVFSLTFSDRHVRLTASVGLEPIPFLSCNLSFQETNKMKFSEVNLLFTFTRQIAICRGHDSSSSTKRMENKFEFAAGGAAVALSFDLALS